MWNDGEREEVFMCVDGINCDVILHLVIDESNFLNC